MRLELLVQWSDRDSDQGTEEGGRSPGTQGLGSCRQGERDWAPGGLWAQRPYMGQGLTYSDLSLHGGWPHLEGEEGDEDSLS